MEDSSRPILTLVGAQRTATSVAEHLREAILFGRIGPGTELKEERLAQELGISRTPIREALLRLKSEGLIEETPGRPARVRTLDHRALADLYELRSVLDAYSSRRAAERATDAQLQYLEQLRKEIETCDPETDLNGLLAAVRSFHVAIAEAATSARLDSFVRRTLQVPFEYEARIWRLPGMKARFVEHHNRIMTALARRNPDRAELEMKQYLLELRDVLLDGVAEPSDVEDVGASGADSR